MGEYNTVASAYTPIRCIGTSNSIALTHRCVIKPHNNNNNIWLTRYWSNNNNNNI